MRLLPGVMPYVKSTEAEARRFHRELMELSPSAHRYGHRPVVGTPERIADLLTQRVDRSGWTGHYAS